MTALEKVLREARDRLPRPSPEATERAFRAALAAHVGRPRRTPFALVAAAVVLVAAGVAIGLVAAPRGETARPAFPPAGPGFLPTQGWNTLGTDRIAVAANVPLPDDLASLGKLPAHGIVLVARFSSRTGPAKRPRLSLEDARVIRGDGPVVYRLRPLGLEIDVLFGSEPSARMLAEAQRQLDRLATPPITIDARPTVYGGSIFAPPEPVLLIGAIASGEQGEVVTIQRRECGGSFYGDLLDTRTDAQGAFHVNVDALIRTDFRAVWKGAASRPATVLVRPSVRLQQLSKRLFSVDIVAQRYFRGAKLDFQRFDRRTRSWITVKKVLLERGVHLGRTLHTTGRFRASLPKGALVRIVLPRSQAGPCYIAGYSHLLTVR